MLGQIGSMGSNYGGASGGMQGGAASPNFWQQMMAKRQAQAAQGAQEFVGGGQPGSAGLVSSMGQNAKAWTPNAQPGQNMGQMQSAMSAAGTAPAQAIRNYEVNQQGAPPNLQALQARAAAMSAGGAAPAAQGMGQMSSMAGAQQKPSLMQRLSGGMGNMAGGLAR